MRQTESLETMSTMLVETDPQRLNPEVVLGESERATFDGIVAQLEDLPTTDPERIDQLNATRYEKRATSDFLGQSS